MKKLIINIFIAFIFIGCGDKSEVNKGIELKNHLTFEGSVTPAYHEYQLYILRNGTCVNPGNSYVVLDTIDHYDKDLFPFGVESDIINREFCIEQKNGKTFLYINDSFKRKHSKEEAVLATENLIIAINKTKIGDQVENENKNFKSWN